MSGELPAPEFSRLMDRRGLPADTVELVANEHECAALAARFGIVSINRLTASVTLIADGEVVKASGTLQAEVIQNCAISGDELPVKIAEELSLRFVPAREITDEEIELEAEELDEIAYSGTGFDLGEAIAQSLALAIDPYLTGPEADRVREEHDLAEKGPSGPLQAALTKMLKKG